MPRVYGKAPGAFRSRAKSKSVRSSGRVEAVDWTAGDRGEGPGTLGRLLQRRFEYLSFPALLTGLGRDFHGPRHYSVRGAGDRGLRRSVKTAQNERDRASQAGAAPSAVGRSIGLAIAEERKEQTRRLAAVHLVDVVLFRSVTVQPAWPSSVKDRRRTELGVSAHRGVGRCDGLVSAADRNLASRTQCHDGAAVAFIASESGRVVHHLHALDSRSAPPAGPAGPAGP